MIKLPGIIVINRIYESRSSLIYRARREEDHFPVILKTLKKDYPSLEEIARYKQEYQITRSLNVEGIITVYNQQEYERSMIISLEDFGGESLEYLMKNNVETFSVLSLSQFFPIAIKITTAINNIHARKVIHRDINPSNIVFNPLTGVVKIIDFGIATHLNYSNPCSYNNYRSSGTLAYASPEQTGRMNRSVDYRTDFYSLGATFYKLLTGNLPFPTNDILDLVHCHIAKQPIPAHKLNQDIPPVVSAMIMKLMAKNAEDRYQSAQGIKADLEHCFRLFQTTGNIPEFPLAAQDISPQFSIPQKLYGRQEEVALLLRSFEQIVEESPQRKNTALVLVTGYSGIGKSVLVQEIYKPITEKQGYFISGKFDQLQCDIPYSAVVNAFVHLIKQLLSESTIQVQQWREKLLKALGNNAQVIINVIPELELIIGKQPSLPDLGTRESQNRFRLVFQNFIQVFCNAKHPLVIFLDDLQWADSASLQLIQLMLEDSRSEYLLVVGAYRDNEVSYTHPLMITLSQLSQKGVNLNTITLNSLSLKDITHLVADTLHSDSDTLEVLGTLIKHKTEGNPFFINQFLHTLHSENLLIFDEVGTRWQWDIQQIQELDITDNVVELMIGKIKKLSPNTQKIICLAACVGESFDLDTLSVICESSKELIFSDLLPALQAGLILPLSELNEELMITSYRFLHDRVQQAAYAIIDEDEKKPIHLQIGRLLLTNTKPEILKEKLFVIADHFNYGISFITNLDERLQIAQLNLKAGTKAIGATAYEVGHKYLRTGVELLGDNSWQTDYNLCLTLHQQAAKAAYLKGDFTVMEWWILQILNNSKNVIDKVQVYDIKIQKTVSNREFRKAIAIGLEILELLGLILPKEPTKTEVEKALITTASNLNKTEIKDLINLPQMIAPEALAIIYILSSIAAAAYLAEPNLVVLVVCKMVDVSLQYGNAPYSAVAYSAYGLMQCGIVGNIEVGYQFGLLAADLIEKLNVESIKSKVFDVLGAHIFHWQTHYHQSLPILMQGYQSGVATGDWEMAAYNIANLCYCLHFTGTTALKELEQQVTTYSKAVQELRQTTVINWLALLKQYISYLLNNTKDNKYLFNEDEILQQLITANDRHGLFNWYLHKLILCYLFGEYEQAVNNAILAEQYVDGVIGYLTVPIYYFYDSLARLAHRKVVSEHIQKNQIKMAQWAHYAPMNFRHKLYLIQAEISSTIGDLLEAEDLYEKAIEGAQEHKYVQEEALAYELAAEFYLKRGRKKIAQTYMKEAHYIYEQWGAIAKVRYLEEKYPQLLLSKSHSHEDLFTTQPITILTDSSWGKTIDLSAVIRANQTISSEIDLERLMSSLIKILLQSSGARKAYLLLPSSAEITNVEQWQVEAIGNMDCSINEQGMEEQNINTQIVSSPVVGAPLPLSLINYVIRTQESVVLDDAAIAGEFTRDTYIQEEQIRSLICASLSNQNNLLGIIYLENNILSGAFTREKLELIKLLSSQASISLYNAQLYKKLQKSEQQISQFLNAIPIGVNVFSSDGKFIFSNPKAQEIHGVASSDKITFEEIPAVFQAYKAGTDKMYPVNEIPILRALAGENVRIDDMELRTEEGNIFLEVYATPIYGESGDIVCVITTFNDITEQKQAQKLLADYNQSLELQVMDRVKELQQQWEVFRTLFDQIPLMLALCDELGNILLANWELEKFFAQIDSPGESCQASALLNSVLNFSETYQDYRIIKLDGQEVVVSWKTARLSDGRVMIIGENITDIYEFERMKKEFFVVINHELPTPLTTVHESLRLLVSDVYRDKPGMAQYLINISLRNIERVVRLVNGISDLTRCNLGKVQLVKEDCYIWELMEQAREAVEMFAYQANVSLCVTPIPVKVLVCPEAIVQVLIHLFTNAIRFSPPGTLVELEAIMNPADVHNVVVMVKDQAGGIPEDKIDSVFNCFRQLKSLDFSERTTTELGLAFCRTIIKQHQGNIWVESIWGQGSTFNFTLPIVIS